MVHDSRKFLAGFVLPIATLLLGSPGCISSGASPSPGGRPQVSATGTQESTRALARNPLLLTDLDGRSHDLDELLAAGQQVALVFYQTWCKPCMREAPQLAIAARSYQDQIHFFGIVSGPDDYVDPRQIADWVDRFQLPYPQVWDRDLKLMKRFAVQGTPTIIVLGAEAQETYRGHHAPDRWLSHHEPLSERERTLGVMGTELIIKVQGTHTAGLEAAIDAAIAELERVEDLMTDWRSSELTRLNDAAGSGLHEVPREMAAIIARGLEIGRLTGGAFDLTYAGVGRLWSFKDREHPQLPTPTEVATALASVGSQRVTVSPVTNQVDLPAGMRIGLGGIAKGYGVDRAMHVLREHGIEHAIVNAGGDLKVLGTDQGKPWEVAVKHPRDAGRAIAVLRLENQCLVTSGDYERFFEIDGKRYHHIIDPRTGYPSQGCISATVIGPNAEFCDALATSLCVLGPAEGLAVIEQLPRIEALLVDLSGKVHVSSGLAGQVD